MWYSKLRIRQLSRNNMNNGELVSIIVPVYNAEQYINKCIDCILEQTYQNIELILVDDGSSDKSAQIIDEESRNDERILVIHKSNGGASDARNTGLSICRGEYVCFVDADDIIDPEYVMTMLTIAKEHDCDIVQCEYKRVDNRDIVFNKGENEISVVNNIDMLNRIYSKYNVDTIVLWNKMFKKSVIADNMFPVGIMFEDEVFCPRVIYNASRIAITNATLYYYFHNSSSVMNMEYSKKKLDIFTALKLRMDFYCKCGLKDLYEKDLYKYMNKLLQNIYLVRKSQMADKLSIKRNLIDDYWGKYRESLSVSWPLRRKIALLVWGIFPGSYSFFRKVPQ